VTHVLNGRANVLSLSRVRLSARGCATHRVALFAAANEAHVGCCEELGGPAF
jgi:hypothetical protein